MEQRSNAWLVPLTGVAFVVLTIVGFLVAGEPKPADDPVNEVVSYYVDDKDSIQIGAVIGVAALVLLIFFGAHLRGFLRGASGGDDTLPLLSLLGLAIVGVGLAFDNTILFATAEAAEDIDPAAVQALQALWDNSFLPIALGIEVFLWATGICIVRTGALPKWIGWVVLVLAVLGVTPIGFVAAIGAALLVLVLSIMLSLQARSAPGAPAPPPATP